MHDRRVNDTNMPSPTIRILAISGSLKAQSANHELLQLARSLAPSMENIQIELFAGLRDLPHFEPDLDGENPPAPVTAWRRAIAESDALLIACPEYGFSLPGALKNAVD